MASIQELTDGFPVPVVSAAYTATGDTTNAGPVVPIKGTLVQVQFIPSAGITANGTNFTTLTVQNKGTNGLSGTTAMASRVWSAGNSTASTPENFTLSGTAANLEVQAGDVLQIVQTHGGTGLIIPAGSFVFYIRPHR
jgi:hypothetical protein